MIRTALVGLGKMGISHQAILRSTSGSELVAVCDSTPLLPTMIEKYTGTKAYSNFNEMLANEDIDAVVIATPPKAHVPMVQAALTRQIAVFCEKPFVLNSADGEQLAREAERLGIVNQVGYHYRFVASFVRAKELIEAGVIGRIHHTCAEAYGPVVLRPATGTWRGSRASGGGALYDYATHAIDLLNFCLGKPSQVLASVTKPIFSSEVDDEVYALLGYSDGKTASLNINWSDESHRKMSTKLTIYGENGKIVADRQEIQVYLREPVSIFGLRKGWNVSYTTDLTEEVDYYLRGEEYSLQIDDFVKHVQRRDINTRSTFRSAVEADQVADAIRAASGLPATPIGINEASELTALPRKSKVWERLFSGKSTQTFTKGKA